MSRIAAMFEEAYAQIRAESENAEDEEKGKKKDEDGEDEDGEDIEEGFVGKVASKIGGKVIKGLHGLSGKIGGSMSSRPQQAIRAVQNTIASPGKHLGRDAVAVGQIVGNRAAAKAGAAMTGAGKSVGSALERGGEKVGQAVGNAAGYAATMSRGNKALAGGAAALGTAGVAKATMGGGSGAMSDEEYQKRYGHARGAGSVQKESRSGGNRGGRRPAQPITIVCDPNRLTESLSYDSSTGNWQLVLQEAQMSFQGSRAQCLDQASDFCLRTAGYLIQEGKPVPPWLKDKVEKADPDDDDDDGEDDDDDGDGEDANGKAFPGAAKPFGKGGKKEGCHGGEDKEEGLDEGFIDKLAAGAKAGKKILGRMVSPQARMLDDLAQTAGDYMSAGSRMRAANLKHMANMRANEDLAFAAKATLGAGLMAGGAGLMAHKYPGGQVAVTTDGAGTVTKESVQHYPGGPGMSHSNRPLSYQDPIRESNPSTQEYQKAQELLQEASALLRTKVVMTGDPASMLDPLSLASFDTRSGNWTLLMEGRQYSSPTRDGLRSMLGFQFQESVNSEAMVDTYRGLPTAHPSCGGFDLGALRESQDGNVRAYAEIAALQMRNNRRR